MLFTSLALSALVAVSSVAAHSKPNRARDVDAALHVNASSDLAKRGLPGPDHPDWLYLNSYTWWKMDPTQQDHARFHGYLSMSAYGDYKKLCPKTFTRGFTVLASYDAPGKPVGQSFYIARIPEMDKIVVVFKGNGLEGLDWTPVSISSLVPNCRDCTVAKGVYDLYMLAKKASNNFKVAKDAVTSTGLKFSVTGHGVGGAVAALAALEMGAVANEPKVHYAHNQGMPRAFNYPAVVRYDNLFQVLAGQSVVNRNDKTVQQVPASYNFYHVGQKFRATGDKDQWLTNCWGNNENSTCLGDGSSTADHLYYWTPLGQCGSANKGF